MDSVHPAHRHTITVGIILHSAVKNRNSAPVITDFIVWPWQSEWGVCLGQWLNHVSLKTIIFQFLLSHLKAILSSSSLLSRDRTFSLTWTSAHPTCFLISFIFSTDEYSSLCAGHGKKVLLRSVIHTSFNRAH